MKKVFPFILLALIFAGCNKEMFTNTLMVTTEPTEDPDNQNGNAKTALVDEAILVWQPDDEILVRNIESDIALKATYKSSGSQGKAIFETEETTEKYSSTTKFLAVFPYQSSSLGEGNGTNAKVLVCIPKEQDYVDDLTFGKTACPMVAYGGYDDNGSDGGLSRIEFHTLAGLVRIQICSEVTHPLDKITFTSLNKPIAGTFRVTEYSSHNPTLAPYSGTDNEVAVDAKPSNTITLNVGGKCELSNTPQTFYLVLPAQATQAQELEYAIEMLVTTQDDYQLRKTFSAKVRRNSIVKLPAINVTTWGIVDRGDGDATPTIAGDGTPLRPFLIYDYKDLLFVNNAFNNMQVPTINGKNLNTETCHFRIMNSQIELGADWTQGIPFNGILTNGANQNVSNPGIVNNTNVPLFSSISTGSSVSGLTVRGNSVINSATGEFSPFCGTNNGYIINCHVSRSASYARNASTSTDVGVAGICVTNNGTISGCGCGASLVAPNVAGICLHNNSDGTITACYAASPMHFYVVNRDNITDTFQTARGAGICYENSGKINDCYFGANTARVVNASLGGIAYNNSGNINNCYIATSGVMQSRTSIGGIVHTMSYGVVDNCWNEADVMSVLSGTQGLGSIVNTLTGGEVRNCIRYQPEGMFKCTAGPVGGVVATMSNGTVYNSAFFGDLSLCSTTVKGAVVGNLTGGTIANCYGLQTPGLGPDVPFYGSRVEPTDNITISHSYASVAETVSNTSATPSIDIAISAITSYSELTSSLNDWEKTESTSVNNTGLPSTEKTYRQWTPSGSNPPTLSTSDYLPVATSNKGRR